MKLHALLVPLDGSPFAEAALPMAQEVAERTGARLRLVLVHEARPGGVAGDQAAAADLELQRWEREYLDAVAASLPPSGGQPVDAELLEGLPGPVLAAEVTGRRCELVVMATHGRGAANRFWLGSVADYLIRHLECPILLVRADGRRAGATPPRLRRILVALDTSTASERILDAVTAVAGAGAEVTVLHVVEPVFGAAQPGLPYPVPMDPRLVEDLSGVARQRLERVTGRLVERGVTGIPKVLVGTGAAHRILEEVGAGGYDTVALTTHGAGGLRRLLLGSVADKVVRGADVPVLVWRPPAE